MTATCCGVTFPATSPGGGPATDFPIVVGENVFASLAELYELFPLIAWSWDSASSTLLAVTAGSAIPGSITMMAGWALEDGVGNWALEDGVGNWALEQW